MEEEFLKNKKQKDKKLFIILTIAPLVVAIVLFLLNGDSGRNSKYSQFNKKMKFKNQVVKKTAALDSIGIKMSANLDEVNTAGKNPPDVSKTSENEGEKVERSPDEELENKYLLMQNKLIQEKLKRLETVRSQLDSDLSGKIRSEEERTDKLVKVVEKMKPQAAAQFMENISSELAISILEKLSDVKSSKIFNLMTKEKLARIGEKFVGMDIPETDNRTPASQSEKK